MTWLSTPLLLLAELRSSLPTRWLRPELLNVSFANPTVTVLATNEILRNLLGCFPAWDSVGRNPHSLRGEEDSVLS